MSVNKGKKICRFYPVIKIKEILIFSVIFLCCPLPVILFEFFSGFLKNLQHALSFLIVLDVSFFISFPFIIFIIYYLQSLTIYSNGILSFNPTNNKSNFMLWESMKDIKYNPNIRKGYYLIDSFDHTEQLWLPAYINTQKEFSKVVSEYAGQGHIITSHLQNEGKS